MLKGTQGGSSEMYQGVVVCEDVELGAQEVVTKLLCDCPFEGQEFRLHAGVVGLVLLCGTQPSTCVGQDPSLSTLITSQIKDSSLHSQMLVTPQVKGSSHHKSKARHITSQRFVTSQRLITSQVKGSLQHSAVPKRGALYTTS